MNLRQVRELLKDPVEYEGFVHKKGGKLYFTVSGHKLTRADLLSGVPTFHTHNVAEKDGGYDPPSVKDLRNLFLASRKINGRVVIEHYVITKNNIYCLKLNKPITEKQEIYILNSLELLKKQTNPGGKYNKKWLHLIQRFY